MTEAKCFSEGKFTCPRCYTSLFRKDIDGITVCPICGLRMLLNEHRQVITTGWKAVLLYAILAMNPGKFRKAFKNS